MDWSTLFLGVLVGILLLPTLLMFGLRVMVWLLARKVRKVVAQMERGEMPQGWTVQTVDFGSDSTVRPVEVLPTALPAQSSLHQALREAFLQKTALSAAEWSEVESELLFVHDGLNDNDLEAMGLTPGPGATARERVQGQRQLLGTLNEPVAADVYRR